MAAKVAGTSRAKGRGWVAIFLLGFVAVASGVIWRRSAGYDGAKRLADLDRSRMQLEAQKARLEADIRDLSSRLRLGPVVEKGLQMKVAPDSQVIILPRPPR